MESSWTSYEDTVEESDRVNDDDWTHEKNQHDGLPYYFFGTKEKVWLRCFCATKHGVNYAFAQTKSFVDRWDSNEFASFRDCDRTKDDTHIEKSKVNLTVRYCQKQKMQNK